MPDMGGSGMDTVCKEKEVTQMGASSSPPPTNEIVIGAVCGSVFFILVLGKTFLMSLFLDSRLLLYFHSFPYYLLFVAQR